jgi:Cd2+/Zn2+-exporting ATPase
VLIKGGAFLEAAGAIHTIAFDKTGTLTEGKPAIASIIPCDIEERELVSIACSLEEFSSHPIAQSIVQYARDRGISPSRVQGFENIVGRGVQGDIEGVTYFAGSRSLFMNITTPIADREEQIIELQNSGNTLVFIGTKSSIRGIIAVSDPIRQTTVHTLKRLNVVGIRDIVMLTGDHEGTARKIAAEANVNRYFANMMPEDKAAAIKQLQSECNKVAMVGDGINDAPALATADVGIAMGGVGTSTAMETADIVLMADNLEQLPHTIQLSRKALTIIKQNIWFSILVKALALLFIFPGWLTLWIAVLSDTGAAIIVILNSMRLLRFKC